MTVLYVLILVIGAVACFFGPWWVIAPVCFAVCWWKGRRPSSSFWISALGGITLWLFYTLYLNAVADTDLTGRVAGIFMPGAVTSGIPGIIPMAAVTALIAGLVGGFSGLAGTKLWLYVINRHFDRREKSP